MPLSIILVELKNSETNRWEYIEDYYFELPSLQRRINSNLRICQCKLFNGCGEGFYELFSEMEKKENNSELFKGLPNDVSTDVYIWHTTWFYEIKLAYSASFLSLNNLIAFDYNQLADKNAGWEEMCSVQCAKSGSRILKNQYDTPFTYRKALGEKFFKDLDYLKTLGKTEDVRIVYWFWETDFDFDTDDSSE
jgi:hypothetical protein